jgi:ADP-ribose pyrophosphatase
MDLTEKQISQKNLFTGQIFNLKLDDVVLPNSKISTREYVEHPGGVCVLAVDPDDNVIMIKQYRYPLQELIYELPAGKLNPGEDPMQCGFREFTEETGYIADKLELMCQIYPLPAYSTEILHLYLAHNLSLGQQNLDDNEFLQVEKIHISKVKDMIFKNEIKDAKTQIAIFRYLNYYKTRSLL